MWWVGGSSSVSLVIKGDRISKHEDPIHGTKVVCPERFVRCGSLVLIDRSNLNR